MKFNKDSFNAGLGITNMIMTIGKEIIEAAIEKKDDPGKVRLEDVPGFWKLRVGEAIKAEEIDLEAFNKAYDEIAAGGKKPDDKDGE